MTALRIAQVSIIRIPFTGIEKGILAPSFLSRREWSGRECVQNGELAPQVYEAIESVQSPQINLGPRDIRPARPIRAERTAGGGGVVLDSSTLTVELVVDDPLGLGLGGVEAALSGLADRSRARSTLGQTGGVAEHGGLGVGVEGSVEERSGGVIR